MSHCPMCHSLNEGEVPKSAKQRPSIVHKCFFCHYVYCSYCGEDASPQADHFSRFSDTNCGFNRHGVYKRAFELELEE